MEQKIRNALWLLEIKFNTLKTIMADIVDQNEESKGEQVHDHREDSGDEEESDQNYHFYKEYCRLYYANIILTNRL